MTFFRALLVDLRYLSAGVFFYAIMYALGLLIFALTEANTLGLAAWTLPVLGLLPSTFTHIATEKFDGYADRIILELRGTRRRMKVRILSVLVQNTLLVGAGCAFTSLALPHAANATWATVATIIVSTVVLSTMGTVIASHIPHILLATAVFLTVTFVGSDGGHPNLLATQLITMFRSHALGDWLVGFAWFLLPWLTWASVLSLTPALLTRGQRLVRNIVWFGALSAPKLRTPWWFLQRKNDVSLGFALSSVDLLGALALPLAICFFSLNVLGLAKEIGVLGLESNFAPTLSALLVMSIPSATLASQLAHASEVKARDRLLFRSNLEWRRSLLVQTALSAVPSLSLVYVGAILLSRGNLISWSSAAAFMGLLVLGTTIAFLVKVITNNIGNQFAVGLAAYALTLPEVALAKFWPGISGFLPSSIVAQALGGFGPLAAPGAPQPPAWLASIALVVTLLTALATLTRQPIPPPMRRA